MPHRTLEPLVPKFVDEGTLQPKFVGWQEKCGVNLGLSVAQTG